MKPPGDDNGDPDLELGTFLALTCADDPSRRRRMARRLDWLEATLVRPEAHDDQGLAASALAETRDPSGFVEEYDVLSSTVGGTLLDGKYLLERRIGTGGMGVVFLARHLALDRRVAVKFVSNALVDNAAAIRRFEREAVVMARLKHPNIVTIHDFGISDDIGAYLVMEMLEGVTLTQEIRKAGWLPVDRAVAIVGDVCRAVEAAHAAGIIHRDLKPDNVFLESTPDGFDTVKVLDFGIAKLCESDDDDEPTNSVGVVGTPAYMSPEQCRDDVIDARSDVYALGCVLFTCLAGRPPFTGDSVVSLLVRHVDATPPRPSSFNPDLPEELDDVVLRALSKSPGDRQPSAAEFATQMRRAVGVRFEAPRERSAVDLTATRERASASMPRASTLPEPVTSFIGREDDLEALVASIDSCRFVTLIGPGGIGKTRLALEAGRVVRDRFEDGVFVVDLRQCSTKLGVARAFAEHFDVREDPDRPLLETLGETLRNRSALVIADTCEHVVDVVGHVFESLLGAAPRLRIVATSREALDAEGETLFHVLPLEVPRASRRARDTDEILSASAVRLFVERAQRKRKDVDLGAENMELIGRLCTLLDGIPLAIELAAARSNVMTVRQMVDRMNDRFELLTIGGRSGRPRTLRAVIDWSYRLLSDAEREVFARMSVFEGGCTLEAIRSVCRLTDAPTAEVDDLAAALVNKSLVMLEERKEGVRYRMLDTIREYASERLMASDEEARVRQRFIAWVCEEAEITQFGITRGQDQKASLDRCDREAGNFEAALRWAIRDGNDLRAGLVLAARLCHYWGLHGRAVEGIGWLTDAQTAASSLGPSAELAAAMFSTGFLYSTARGDFENALEHTERSLTVARQIADPESIARALVGVSDALLFLGRADEAEAGFKEGLELRRMHSIGEEIDCVILEFCLGVVSFERRDYDEARSRIEATLTDARRLNDDWRCAVMLTNLGEIALRRRAISEAADRFRESIAIAERIGYVKMVAHSRIGLGLATGLGGDAESAHEIIASGLEDAHQGGELRSVSFGLHSLAILAAERRDVRRATFLRAAAEAFGNRFKVQTTDEERAYYDLFLRDACNTKDDGVAGIEERGSLLPLEQVIAIALDPLQDGSSTG